MKFRGRKVEKVEPWSDVAAISHREMIPDDFVR